MRASHRQYSTSSPVTAGPIYSRYEPKLQCDIWYAQDVTYAQYPEAMHLFGLDESRANDPYPFSTQYRAVIAYRRLHGLLPKKDDHVKWTARSTTPRGRSPLYTRFGFVQSVCGSYATVLTDSNTVESVRLDKLMSVEPIVQEGA